MRLYFVIIIATLISCSENGRENGLVIRHDVPAKSNADSAFKLYLTQGFGSFEGKKYALKYADFKFISGTIKENHVLGLTEAFQFNYSSKDDEVILILDTANIVLRFVPEKGYPILLLSYSQYTHQFVLSNEISSPTFE